MKRWICCCLIVAALFGLSVAGFAAGNEKVTLSAAEDSTPGVWVVTVTVSNADSVRSCQLQPEYPQDVFSLEGVSWKIPVDNQQDNPIVAVYEKRASAIRTEKSRGTITAEFAKMATFIAKNNMLRAQENHEYFTTQYTKDMTRKKLYYDTKNMLR